MNFIEFNNVSYTYPAVEDDELQPKPVFDYFTAALPASFISLIGPNASGKSTFMLLASGRVKPQQGKVLLLGQDVAAMDEEARGKLSSFVYQNMEFDTDDKVAELLEYVFNNGLYAGKEKALFDSTLEAFELAKTLDKKLTGIAKGEIQRVLLAFSVLFGSKSVFLDEPMFAMETRQKEKAMDFLRSYSAERKIPVCMAMHELDLSRRYAENVLLFYPDRNMDFGTPDEVLVKEALEKAYGVPAAMLREAEQLNRKSLKEASEAMQAAQEALPPEK
ncbi:MAG: ABC transporter ATP-binding protein [Treponemataceae bacterium]|nr:ABC transporter ATP-binding protein [Treponemataceae bacterium]